MLIHGGDTAGFFSEYGYLPLDFSANVSPFGLPEGVRQAAIKGLNFSSQYPDPLCRELRSAISQKEGCSVSQVLCGNGAADIIFRLIQAKKPKRALLPAPTFSEYGLALEQNGCVILHFFLKPEQNFAITSDILDKIDDSVDILFLCQPNNPTGSLCEKSLLIEILDRCETTGTLLVLDQCFTEFLNNFPDFSLDSHLKSQNLIILKAFTKLYAMAGLRLGYCLSSNQELLQEMQSCGQPWSVSCVAQEAGIQALQETDYVNKVRNFIESEKGFLATNLEHLVSRVFPPAANFIFFQDTPDLVVRLREKGILIRDCSNYHGLAPGYFRVAVRMHDENLRLLQAIEEVKKWENP